MPPSGPNTEFQGVDTMTSPRKTYLLTPGPVTVPDAIKAEMLFDRSSNSAAVTAMTQSIRTYLLEICNGVADYACIPLQGSATYAVEAALRTLVPRDGGV